MKKTLFLLGGMIPAILLAVPVSVQPEAPWKKTADNAAAIDYKGEKIWRGIVVKPVEAFKPDTLYKMTFEVKCTGPQNQRIICNMISFFQGKKQRIQTEISTTNDFTKHTVYFNSGETPKNGNIRIYFNPTVPLQMDVKNINVDEMTDKQLYGQNLLPWGDFEEEASFIPYGKTANELVRVVDTANFLYGEKSLLLDCKNGRSELVSGLVPAIPGKEIEVKFYAKSADDAKVQVILDFGSFPGSKHYYRMFQFKIGKEWKEYSLKFKVSEDFKLHPILLRKLTHFRLAGLPLVKGGTPKVYIDGITYTIDPGSRD